MLKLYNILRQHKISGKPIQILNVNGKYYFKSCLRYEVDPVALNTGKLLIDCGITIGMKDNALASLECVHSVEQELCPKCRSNTSDSDYTIFFPELNMDDKIDIVPTRIQSSSDPTKMIEVYPKLTDVVFIHPLLQIDLSKAQSSSFYLINNVIIMDLGVSHINGPQDLQEFCNRYNSTIVSPEPVNLQMYLGTPKNQRTCIIGGTNNILGSSGAGKSRFISELLGFAQIQGGEKVTPLELSSFRNNISNIRNVLIVADEPSLHVSLWYATAEMNYVVYGLNQKKLQTILRYLVAKYTYDIDKFPSNNKYKLLNIYVDSITELIYAPSKVKQDGEFVSSTTFVKGLSSGVKPEMLTISRSSGILTGSNIIITLITTANIPGTGSLDDETAFWNMVSGNSPNSIWMYKHNVRQTRDRTKEQSIFDSSLSDISSLMSLNDNDDITQGLNREICDNYSSDSISTTFNISDTYSKVKK